MVQQHNNYRRREERGESHAPEDGLAASEQQQQQQRRKSQCVRACVRAAKHTHEHLCSVAFKRCTEEEEEDAAVSE